jgi:hypothetical protein
VQNSSFWWGEGREARLIWQKKLGPEIRKLRFVLPAVVRQWKFIGRIQKAIESSFP